MFLEDLSLVQNFYINVFCKTFTLYRDLNSDLRKAKVYSSSEFHSVNTLVRVLMKS